MTSLELLPTIHLDSDCLFCCCNWWLAALSWQGVVTTFKMIGDWQLHCDNAPTHASRLVQSFFDKTSSHPGDPTPLQPRFGALWCLAFPKTKIPFEREEVSDCWWDSGKYDRAADGDWENCVRFQGAYFEGEWGVIVLCTVFLVSCIFFNKCLYLSCYMAGYLLDRPRFAENTAPISLFRNHLQKNRFHLQYIEIYFQHSEMKITVRV